MILENNLLTKRALAKRAALFCVLWASAFSLQAQESLPTPVTTTPITARPEGKQIMNQVRKATSFYSTGTDGAAIDSVDYYIGDLVEAADGTVYLKNPFTYFPSGTWLKLDRLSGDTLVARLPQAIFEDPDDDNAVYYASRLTLTSSESGQTYGIERKQDGSYACDVKFLYSNGTLTMINGDGETDGMPKSILGVVSASGGWGEYGEASFSVRPLTLSPVQLPSGIHRQLCSFTYTDYYGDVSETLEMGISGNKVYLTNPFTNEDVQWIEGTIEGDSVVFTSQYLGANRSAGYHMFFCPGVYSDLYEEGYELAPRLTFAYDKTKGTLTADDPKSMLINIGDRRLYYAAAYRVPKLAISNVAVARPANPVIDKFSKPGSDGAGSLQFTLPSQDVNGQSLFKGNLYYKIYTGEGKTFVFDPSEYNKLDTALDEIAYGFSDNHDFFFSDDTHLFYIYGKVDSIGVQSIYKGDSELRSDIVWTTGKTTSSVSLIPATTKVVGISYYSLDGRRINEPSRGMFIRQRKTADGKTYTDKIIK